MFTTLALIGAAISMATGPIVIPPSPPPGSQITIDVITVNGSGCPDNSAAVAVAPDNTAFTVTYSRYMAQVGVGAAPTDWRKNCQINLRVNVPSGFTYAIAQADYRGFAHLERGATGLQRANYYFQGMSPTAYISHPLTSPISDNWQNTDTTDVAALVYAPCGERRNFNINTELRVGVGTSDPTRTTSFVAMDSTDGNIRTTYNFAWKRCP